MLKQKHTFGSIGIFYLHLCFLGNQLASGVGVVGVVGVGVVVVVGGGGGVGVVGVVGLVGVVVGVVGLVGLVGVGVVVVVPINVVSSCGITMFVSGFRLVGVTCQTMSEYRSFCLYVPVCQDNLGGEAK